ncbi:MAG TPA: hypothetical protein PKG74_00430 [Candidatus Colwellbacteria bacterium]|nr:hypothetical protein [Candidatus Colwellbacteria bacterium]
MLNFRSFSIYRLTRDEKSGSYGLDFVETGESVSGFLENASPEFAAIAGGAYGKIFSLFSDDFDVDVKTSDRLIDENDPAIKFDVRGVLIDEDAPGRKLQITLSQAIKQ